MLKRLFFRLFSSDQTTKKQLEDAFTPIIGEEGQFTGLMDRVTLEYLQSNAPDPSQHTLDTMLNQVTRVRLMDGGAYNGKALGTQVLLDISDASSIASLRETLAIIEDEETFGHCMCYGDYALEFYQAKRLIATIGLHHGQSIRWDAWKNDAELQDGTRLINWLADKGITAPLEAYHEELRQAEVSRQAMNHWKEAMPDCLSPYWAEMQDMDRKVNIKLMQQALELDYPNPELRALELFKWFGSGKGMWSGYPHYEGVPETLLFEFPTELLISALTKQMLTPQHLEGAARYFAGWNFSHTKKADLQQIPIELKQRLLEHSLSSSDEDRIHRAKRAFSA